MGGWLVRAMGARSQSHLEDYTPEPCGLIDSAFSVNPFYPCSASYAADSSDQMYERIVVLPPLVFFCALKAAKSAAFLLGSCIRALTAADTAENLLRTASSSAEGSVERVTELGPRRYTLEQSGLVVGAVRCVVSTIF